MFWRSYGYMDSLQHLQEGCWALRSPAMQTQMMRTDELTPNVHQACSPYQFHTDACLSLLRVGRWSQGLTVCSMRAGETGGRVA